MATIVRRAGPAREHQDGVTSKQLASFLAVETQGRRSRALALGLGRFCPCGLGPDDFSETEADPVAHGAVVTVGEFLDGALEHW